MREEILEWKQTEVAEEEEEEKEEEEEDPLSVEIRDRDKANAPFENFAEELMSSVYDDYTMGKYFSAKKQMNWRGTMITTSFLE